MKENQSWGEILEEWHGTLTHAVSVLSHTSARGEGSGYIEDLLRFAKVHAAVIGPNALPDKLEEVPPSDIRNAVEDGERAASELRLLRHRLQEESAPVMPPSPSTIAFRGSLLVQARKLAKLATKLNNNKLVLHSRQFAARVPEAYSMPLVENALSLADLSKVLPAITFLYDDGVAVEYVSAAVDPVSLDMDRAKKVSLAYHADVSAEYVGEML